MKQRLTVMAALFLLSAAFCQAQTVLGTIAFQNDKWASYAQVDGKYLYVLLKFGTWEKVRNEIAVWDMSNPGVPVQAGIIPLDFHAYRFLKSGDNLFVISYPSRSETTTIRAINVSNPTRPVVRGTIVVDEELYELRPKVGTADRFLCRYYDAAIQADKARELDISNPAAMRV
jgi:hypothetical protein